MRWQFLHRAVGDGARLMPKASLLVLLVALLPLAILSGEGKKDPSDKRDLVVTQYQKYCADCHGEQLEGSVGPSLIDGAWIAGSDADSIAQSIRDGMPAKGMPGWGDTLSEGEIRNLVIYLREKAAGPRPVAKTVRIPEGVQASERHAFRVEVVVSGGLDYPWSMAVLPDGRWLVTEKVKAELRLVDVGKVLPTPLAGTPPCKRMLEVALHPQYVDNGWIYLSCITSKSDDPDATGIALYRGRMQAGRWADSQTLLDLPGSSITGRIAFDDGGHVFLSTGTTNLTEQRTITYEAQDLSRAENKLYRLYDDGRVPEDNPFVGRPGALPAIWTYGHRVPQGLAFDRTTGLLWSTEHGPRGGDELNLIRSGRNYGWPVITYGMEYTASTAISPKTHQAGMEQPVIYWTPSIAVSSIAFYQGDAFPQWRGNLFVTTLRDRTLYRLELDGERIRHRETILRDVGRMRDIASAPDGYLYILLNKLDEEPSAKLIRLVPAGD